MLLDSVAKIVSSVISFRLQNILKDVGCEYQNGFTSRRGCADGLFSIKMALQKRKEHELDTWLLFIDLVKAFDTVPRSSLWKVLAKYGVPPHLVKVIAALNTDCTVKLDVDGEDIEIKYTIGVKQGDNLAPVVMAHRNRRPDGGQSTLLNLRVYAFDFAVTVRARAPPQQIEKKKSEI